MVSIFWFWVLVELFLVDGLDGSSNLLVMKV